MKWNEEFVLHDRSYSISDIQDYYEHIMKKHQKVTDNPQIRIYANRIGDRIMFSPNKTELF